MVAGSIPSFSDHLNVGTWGHDVQEMCPIPFLKSRLESVLSDIPNDICLMDDWLLHVTSGLLHILSL